MCFSMRKISPEAKTIERDLRKAAKEMMDTKKILLLGAVFSFAKEDRELFKSTERNRTRGVKFGDTGKTTFAKQMTMEYAQKSYEEKYIEITRMNVLYVTKEILSYLRKLEFDFPGISLKHVQAVTESSDLMDVVDSVIFLRDQCGFIQKTLEENGDNLNVPGGREGADYFLANVERVTAPDFVPTKEDILRSRTRTTGVNETQFTFDGQNIILVDVGGQRSERRKWLSSFSGVISGVIFVVSLADYNTVLEEDQKTNRLLDSVQLFRSLQTSTFLEKVPFIIFLNKLDMFKTKIVDHPLPEVFHNYPKDNALADPVETGIAYVSQLFKNAAVADPYIFPTCTLDTTCCVRVFKALYEDMMRSALLHSGMV